MELVALTEKLAALENRDRAEFARLLGVRTPEKWPPPLNNADSVQWAWSHAREHPGGGGSGMWYVALPVGSGDGGRIGPGDGAQGDEGDIGEALMIGTCGFPGLPSDDGTVETGYSVFDEHQGKGYGTELVRALVGWAFGGRL